MDEGRARTRLDEGELAAMGSLDDPTRRRLYEYVASLDGAATRDQAGAALGLERSLVAYHLDKLVDEGLLEASFARPPGRGGPGAGRPAKHYRRADREFAVTLPPRDYRLLAELLVAAVDSDSSGAVRAALERAAAERGRALGAAPQDQESDEAGAALSARLAELGFEPYDDGGVIRLRNCPFHPLAREHTQLVCGMNLTMLRNLSEALELDVHPRLDPAPGRCCVAFE